MIRAIRRHSGNEIDVTDDSLLERMIAGDEDAFTLLYRRKHPAIYRFVLHMGGNAQLAEDGNSPAFAVEKRLSGSRTASGR